MTDGQRKKINSSLITWRFALVVLVIMSVFVVLAARAAYIQLIEPDKLIREGDNRTLRTEKLSVQRGMIFDRHGNELAVSVPVLTVYADPNALDKWLNKRAVYYSKKSGLDVEALQADQQAWQAKKQQLYESDHRWQALSDVLQIDRNQIKKRMRDNPSRKFVYLKRQITPPVASYINDLRLPGVHLLDESKRYYPAGEITAHVLGFTNIDGQGIEGIEKLFDDALTGEKGRRTVRKDRLGREVEVLTEQDRVEPKSIYLSIDQRIQTVAYQSLKSAVLTFKATSGSAMVVDVHTGEILAMVNSPSFNPNNRATTHAHKLRNRAITDLFEPGSSIKPLPILAALEFGSIEADTIVNTHPGWMRVGGSIVQDTENRGEMTLREIIKKSSNMGTSKVALELPKEYLIDFYQRIGFGEDTGTGMVGESSGLFRPDRRWSDFEIATLSFGYAVSVSTAQLARLYATLGSGGLSRPLTILKQEQQPEGQRIAEPRNVNAILTMMESVFEKGGTAAKLKIPGYRIAGKTGTGKKAAMGGYGDEYVGYFAGVGPVTDPQIAVVVLINEPGDDVYSGGATAGPVFAEIMAESLRTLNVAPDAESVANTEKAHSNTDQAAISREQGADNV